MHRRGGHRGDGAARRGRDRYGAFLGALVLTILRNGFTLQGISAYTYNIILGVAILVAMILNVYVARLRGAGDGE